MLRRQPSAWGATAWRIFTGPVFQSQYRPSDLSLTRTGTGARKATNTTPTRPFCTSGEPRPTAPRTWGAQLDQHAGRASSRHAASGRPRLTSSKRSTAGHDIGLGRR